MTTQAGPPTGDAGAERRLIPRLPGPAWIVLGGDALSALGSGLTLPFFLVYVTRIRGIELGVGGLALGTVAIVGLAASPIAGWLIDRIGSRRALILGLLVAALGAILVTWVRVTWQAFAAAAVIGLGTALITPAQDALLATVVAPAQRSSIFAIRNATLNAGYALGAVGASLIADLASPGSFELLYTVDGLTFLAFVPILAFVLRRTGDPVTGASADAHGSGAQASRGYRAVLGDRLFLRVWALMALLVTVGFAQTVAGFPAYATRTGGVGAGAVGLAFAANTLTVVVAQLPMLRLMVGRRRTSGIILACTFWAAAWSVTLIAGGLEGALAVVAFTIALILFGIGETLLAPSQAALINDLAPEELRGRYNAVYSLAWTTGFAAGPAVAGFVLSRWDGAVLFGGLMLGCALAAIAAARIGRALPSNLDVIA